jgi:hypothetical protein
MAEQGSAKTKSTGRRSKSDVLTTRQMIWALIIAGLAILSMAVLYWNGFPVGNTIGPMIVGGIFLTGICYTIKTGVFNWKGGGHTYRNQEPFAFWFWVSVFTILGLFAIFVGLLGLLKYWAT